MARVVAIQTSRSARSGTTATAGVATIAAIAIGMVIRPRVVGGTIATAIMVQVDGATAMATTVQVDGATATATATTVVQAGGREGIARAIRMADAATATRIAVRLAEHRAAIARRVAAGRVATDRHMAGREEIVRRAPGVADVRTATTSHHPRARVLHALSGAPSTVMRS